ncbi:MAG: glycosyltransferase, partial [Anaerolineales bacterium]|nr:glycosyltransferase [Anaerolineales bacterium]
MTGSMLFWFKDYLDKVGWDKASLLMHTEPHDPNGQNLYTIIQDLGLMKAGKVKFSQQKMPAEGLNMLYNAVDATINISDAEGFGLPILESLSAETPAIVNMTGGPQELVTDGNDWFGIGIKPASRAIIGSQQIPYIYEDRISGEDFVSALEKFTNLSKEERKEMGRKGREHAIKNYNFETFNKTWVDELTKVYEKE